VKGHQARKRFGQNFLHDQNVIDRIVDTISAGPGQHVVEIGPGQGAITRRLASTGCRLTVIEIDRDLVARLTDDPELGNAEIISADALNVDLAALAADGPVRLVGNLPYNISTPLLFHAMGQIEHITDMYFMLQKEVVDRMAAAPGGKSYGRLSVMLQYQCSVMPLFVVKPGSFNPVPRVNSAVVRLAPREVLEPAANDHKLLAQVVTAAFGKRRKTLSNALKGVVSQEQLVAVGVNPGDRAERLSVADFVRIANQLRPS
jgi:16S rRNA (adenine1518-N6/adenine1519-N6)-dimethyltransferase